MVEKTKKQKHVIPVATFNKWQLRCDKEFSTLSWLQCDKDSTLSFVETLWCVACRKFETSIEGMKNFHALGLLLQVTRELVTLLIMRRLSNIKLQ